MEIDKKNGNVGFVEKTHEYFNLDNPEKKYISVTTLIHRYTQPFQRDFWSAYKALEKLIPKDAWYLEKKHLLSTKKFDPELLKLYSISENDFNREQQNILDEWDKKTREACERGTKMHAELENSFYRAGKNVDLQKFGIGGKFECRKDYTDLDLPYGVYPEYLIYRESDDHILRIAGQIDLLIKDENNITIADHKFVNSIDTKPKYDNKNKAKANMLYPLNNLPDLNFYHYSMQLSTYAWMLQKINPKFVIRDLIINHYDHDGNNTLYHCDYLKKEVERMLYHYKKELFIEHEREKRKRIEY